MSSTSSSRPSGFSSAMPNRRRPMRNSNTSVQDRELLFESIPRTSARTIQSTRRRLGMIGIERDRSIHDLNTSVQNLALEPSSTPRRSAMDRRTQELIRALDSRDAVDAALISALQEAHAQPSSPRPRNDSQFIRESFAPYAAGSGRIPGDNEPGFQPAPHILRNHQQSMARTRPTPYQTRTRSPNMLFPDPQSTPLEEGFTQEVDQQMNDITETSQRAESSPKFGGDLRVPQSQEKHSSPLYGTQRSATQGPAKDVETDISTATTEEGWEMVAPNRGNGFTAGTLKRIDELRAQCQKTFEAYMEEATEWLDCADKKLDKYRSKSEAFREYQRSRPYGSEKRIGDDNINRRAQRRSPTEKNVVHAAHEEAKPSSKDTCLYCFYDKCDGCTGR